MAKGANTLLGKDVYLDNHHGNVLDAFNESGFDAYGKFRVTDEFALVDGWGKKSIDVVRVIDSRGAETVANRDYFTPNKPEPIPE